MKAIRLQRFKGFIDSGWIEIKPITLLFGYNSSGKSSILQALMMLKQSLENPSLEVPFTFSLQRGVDLGSFEDAVYNHIISNDKPMIISLRVDISKYIGDKVISLDDYNIDLNIEIVYNEQTKAITIIGFTICDMSGKAYLKMVRNLEVQDLKPIFTSEYYNELNNRDIKIKWYNFVPIVKDPDLEKSPIVAITFVLQTIILGVFAGTSNVGPVREAPERNQLFTGEGVMGVGSRGEEAFKLLYLEKFSSKGNGHLEEKVNKWLEKYNYEFKWNILSNNLGQFILIDKRTGLKVSIKDVGFGLSQILPIVVQAYNVSILDTVLIEQPEIHLHARAQAELGDLFIDAITNEEKRLEIKGKIIEGKVIEEFNKRLIIETHSEHLLLRLRRRLAESYLGIDSGIGKIDAEDITVYYIENPAGCSIAHKIQINQKGELVDTPDSFKKFFTDDFEEVMKISQTLAEIKSRES